MNFREWQTLPPEEFKAKLRAFQMTPGEYEALVASITARERMEAEMEAAGTLPTKLPEGKLGDNASWGMPTIVSGSERRGS
ncbi:MAG: hypothetical protein ACK5W4_05500 [Inhella sp.]|jgi:hypothetical protein|uniref:hypothetical protein n=1 Tax=Inhella sp. TaxID=1921806 RepID=UPI00391B9A77